MHGQCMAVMRRDAYGTIGKDGYNSKSLVNSDGVARKWCITRCVTRTLENAHGRFKDSRTGI